MAPLPPEAAHVGNLRLLDEPLIALLCSQGCLGDLILKTYDLARSMRDAGVPVIGGFQTPMEQECLRLLLRGEQPVVVCPARSICLSSSRTGDGVRLKTVWWTPATCPVRYGPSPLAAPTVRVPCQ